jgi:hypothetical protein
MSLTPHTVLCGASYDPLRGEGRSREQATFAMPACQNGIPLSPSTLSEAPASQSPDPASIEWSSWATPTLSKSQASESLGQI